MNRPYLECVEQINDVELSEMQNRGAIKITLKKRERIRMKNSRPLTLRDFFICLKV